MTLSLFTLAFAVAAASADDRAIVSAARVLDAVPHHPALVEAEAKLAGANAERLKRTGAFDLLLQSRAGADPLGEYSQRTALVGLETALPVLGGPRVFGGYEFGNDLPVYEGKLQTGPVGRVQLGLRADVGSGLFTDVDRTALAVADLGIVTAEAQQRATKLKLAMNGLSAYWKWVVAGHKLAVEERLVDLALARQRQIEQQVNAGNVARVVRVDNERLLYSRKARLERARLDLTAAGRMLSYYLRDESGAIQPVTPDAVPYWGWAAVGPGARPSAPAGPGARPELDVLDGLSAQADAERRLAREQLLPQVELSLTLQQDVGGPVGVVGSGWAIGETRALAGVAIKWPVLQRQARGASAGASAKVSALAAERRQTRETIQVELDNLRTTLDAQLVRLELERRAARAALTLEEAERRRFELGQSDLLAVNLREQASAKELSEFWATAGAVEVAQAFLSIAGGELPGAPLIAQDARAVTVPRLP